MEDVMQTYWGVQILTGANIGIKARSMEAAREYFRKNHAGNSWIVLTHTAFKRAFVMA